MSSARAWYASYAGPSLPIGSAAACLAVGYIACNLALDVTTATNVGFLVALPVVFAPFIAQVVRHVRYPRAMIPF